MTGAGAVYTPAHATGVDAEVPDERREVKSVDVEITHTRQGVEGLAAGGMRGLASARVVPAGGFAYRFVKRVFDIVFSACAVAVGFVPVAVLCAAIRLDSPGSPFFSQERVGFGGRRIRIWKLRTMYIDAHEHPERYMTASQLDVWRREQKLDGDPRVTRVGRLLRATSLDELPQLFSVLVGDMSLVGPRPVTMAETYEFGEHRDEALSVRPGLTGLWQVTARNDATWESGRRQELELEYVRTRSLRLDMRILLGTVGAVVRKTGK